MDLSIIIVSWNVKEKLRECLQSIKDHVGILSYEVFVVDNASKDGSAEMVRQEFSEAHLVVNEFNAGFAKANNQAIKLSRGRYVLLLNPDMRLLPCTLQGMVEFMREPRNAKVGVAGCYLVQPRNVASGFIPDSGGAQGPALQDNYETIPHVRRFPTILDQVAVLLKLPHIFPHILDDYLMKNFDYSKEARVDSIRGSFFMIRRELLDKIGLLDEKFFIWFEEVDFCKRARTAGYEVAYTPSVKCVDYVGQSFKQIHFYPKQKMFTRSMVYYFKKHRPWWEWRLIWCLRPLVLAGAWVGDKLRR